MNLAKLELHISADSPEDLLDAVRGLVPKEVHFAPAGVTTIVGYAGHEILAADDPEIPETPQPPAPRRRRTKAEMEAEKSETGTASTQASTLSELPPSTSQSRTNDGPITVETARAVMKAAMEHAKTKGRNVLALAEVLKAATKSDAHPDGFGAISGTPPELLPAQVAALEAYMAT